MDNTSVIIIGAGPSGLALALSLAQLKTKTVVLEKETQITEDPRGVYLSGDAVRVLWSLGIQADEFATIGHESEGFMFHKSSFVNRPFHAVVTDTDWRHQVVPDGIMQIQPELEKILRQKAEASGYCQLRYGCEVVSVNEVEKGMSVEYLDSNGQKTYLTGSWLVGADGKKGFIRKNYLEPVAGVKQEPGLYAYEGTWVAANLHIRLPTPETHPSLPVWGAGMTPQAVYDLFWPDHVHLCSSPGKPTASMRFGPQDARLWRHEFAEPDWDDSKKADELLWEHLLPMLTRFKTSEGRQFREPVTFPKDCIEVRRCRPYSFVQKVANKWFHRRTIIIGDAAHVFPPFGGQGIAAGIRDADSLAWRLAVFDKLPALESKVADDVLDVWTRERKQGIDDSARFTKANGTLANEPETRTNAFLRRCLSAIRSIPILSQIQTPIEIADEEAYRPVKDGFFMPDRQGGGKIAQVYFRQDAGQPVLSDEFLKHKDSILTLVALGDDNDHDREAQIQDLLHKVDLPRTIIAGDSTVYISSNKSHADPQSFKACSLGELGGRRLRRGYEPAEYMRRLGKETKFAILRPDRIVFAAVKNTTELEQCLRDLKTRLGI